jgi:hypothetical protein
VLKVFLPAEQNCPSRSDPQRGKVPIKLEQGDRRIFNIKDTLSLEGQFYCQPGLLRRIAVIFTAVGEMSLQLQLHKKVRYRDL